jgi:hypothetical protein
MLRPYFPVILVAVFGLLLTGCDDRQALAEASFGDKDHPDRKASLFSVISMGRDDDDGKAKKWHIGGGVE